MLVEKIGLKILDRKARPVFEFYSPPIAIQCFEDNTYVESYSDGGTRHTGQGLNPIGSVPFKPNGHGIIPMVHLAQAASCGIANKIRTNSGNVPKTGSNNLTTF